jgi:excisionase family DNA binding protein
MENDTPKIDLDQLMTTEQVAVRTGFSVKTLIDWRHDKKGPRYWKRGRLVRYMVDDVEAWLNQAFCRVEPEQL